jgi:sporulation protein YlmC with PRC-barrel domain
VNIQEALGADVVNAAGEDIAEIEDLVLDQNGEYYEILSVGGFLGIGARRGSQCRSSSCSWGRMRPIL